MSLESDDEMPLTYHVEELVMRLLVVIVVAAIGMVATFFYSQRLIDIIWYNFVDVPAYVYAPHNLILTQLRFSAIAGLALAVPVIVYESFEFMKPGLYPNERRYFISVIPVSVALVALGMLFSYFVVLPVLFQYFLFYSEDVATAGLGLSETFNLILMLSFGFGVVFQIPLLMFLAIKMRVASREWFRSKRLIVWGVFITLATLISSSFDPTGVAGIMVAATMIGLYELTIALLRFTG